MPAAAVIPAPIAYTKVVAVKKLVVGFRGDFTGNWSAGMVCTDPITSSHVGRLGRLLTESPFFFKPRLVYFEKIRVFKAGSCKP